MGPVGRLETTDANRKIEHGNLSADQFEAIGCNRERGTHAPHEIKVIILDAISEQHTVIVHLGDTSLAVWIPVPRDSPAPIRTSVITAAYGSCLG